MMRDPEFERVLTAILVVVVALAWILGLTIWVVEKL